MNKIKVLIILSFLLFGFYSCTIVDRSSSTSYLPTETQPALSLETDDVDLSKYKLFFSGTKSVDLDANVSVQSEDSISGDSGAKDYAKTRYIRAVSDFSFYDTAYLVAKSRLNENNLIEGKKIIEYVCTGIKNSKMDDFINNIYNGQDFKNKYCYMNDDSDIADTVTAKFWACIFTDKDVSAAQVIAYKLSEDYGATCSSKNVAYRNLSALRGRTIILKYAMRGDILKIVSTSALEYPYMETFYNNYCSGWWNKRCQITISFTEDYDKLRQYYMFAQRYLTAAGGSPEAEINGIDYTDLDVFLLKYPPICVFKDSNLYWSNGMDVDVMSDCVSEDDIQAPYFSFDDVDIENGHSSDYYYIPAPKLNQDNNISEIGVSFGLNFDLDREVVTDRDAYFKIAFKVDGVGTLGGIFNYTTKDIEVTPLIKTVNGNTIHNYIVQAEFGDMCGRVKVVGILYYNLDTNSTKMKVVSVSYKNGPTAYLNPLCYAEGVLPSPMPANYQKDMPDKAVMNVFVNPTLLGETDLNDFSDSSDVLSNSEITGWTVLVGSDKITIVKDDSDDSDEGWCDPDTGGYGCDEDISSSPVSSLSTTIVNINKGIVPYIDLDLVQ